MTIYVLLTRLSPEAIKGPQAFTALSHQVGARIKANCPEVNWVARLD